MKVFVVYDETGRIYGVEYGEKQNLPNKMSFMQFEIPDDAQITGVKIDNNFSKILYIESAKQ